MPMSAQIQAYTPSGLIPLYDRKVVEQSISLAPSTVFAAGTVLGRITTAAANDVQTFTATGTPTGGSFSYTVTNPLTGLTSTLTIPYNSTSTVLQGLANAIWGSGNMTAGGGAWPGSTLTLTGAGALANQPVPVAVAGTNALTGGSSPASSVAHTTTGRQYGTYAAYASGNSDGTQTALCLLKYACATDAAGNITLGTVAGISQFGEVYFSTPAYFGGYFNIADLVGYDSTAGTALGKVLPGGKSNSGILDVT